MLWETPRDRSAWPPHQAGQECRAVAGNRGKDEGVSGPQVLGELENMLFSSKNKAMPFPMSAFPLMERMFFRLLGPATFKSPWSQSPAGRWGRGSSGEGSRRRSRLCRAPPERPSGVCPVPPNPSHTCCSASTTPHGRFSGTSSVCPVLCRRPGPGSAEHCCLEPLQPVGCLLSSLSSSCLVLFCVYFYPVC